MKSVSLSIGTKNEKSLHAAIKELYAGRDGMKEVSIEGWIIDIVKEDMLIEIQTKNFSAIGKKIEKLIKNYKLKLVYPIAEIKWITLLSEDGEILSKRKSPKKGKVIDVFDELIRIPKLINEENFYLEVLLVDVNEIRCKDGKGSWRRKGISIIDRELVSINESFIFHGKNDFLLFLPESLPEVFTSRILCEHLDISVQKSRKAIYCMKKAGMISECGKNGNELLYRRCY